MRLSKGLPTEAAQREALLTAGLTAEEVAEAWVDRGKPKPGEPAQPERDHLVGAVRGEDELWVARAGVLASTEEDALRFMGRISAMGGTLCIAATGERYHRSPELGQQVADALRLAAAIREDERRAVLEKARGAIRRRLGRAPTPPDKIEQARKLWKRLDLTAEDIAARVGASTRVLYRALGPRGTPPFGRTKG